MSNGHQIEGHKDTIENEKYLKYKSKFEELEGEKEFHGNKGRFKEWKGKLEKWTGKGRSKLDKEKGSGKGTKCFFCSRHGHNVRDCYFRRQCKQVD